MRKLSNHAAVVRLVVDNNSSSVKTTPRSRAARSSGKCQRPGIAPRARHIETADLLTPSNCATAPVPPKLSTILDALFSGTSDMVPRIVSQNVSFGKSEFSQKVNFHPPGLTDTVARGVKYARMARGKWEYDGLLALRRMKAAIRERLNFDMDSHGGKKQVAGLFDVLPSTLSNWEVRGVPVKNVTEIALVLDVDVYYLLGKTDEMGSFGGRGADGSRENFADALSLINSNVTEIKEAVSSLSRRVEQLEQKAG